MSHVAFATLDRTDTVTLYDSSSGNPSSGFSGVPDYHDPTAPYGAGESRPLGYTAKELAELYWKPKTVKVVFDYDDGVNPPIHLDQNYVVFGGIYDAGGVLTTDNSISDELELIAQTEIRFAQDPLGPDVGFGLTYFGHGCRFDSGLFYPLIQLSYSGTAAQFGTDYNVNPAYTDEVGSLDFFGRAIPIYADSGSLSIDMAVSVVDEWPYS